MKEARSKGGRPSAYKPEYAEQAYKFCLLGADDARLAHLFGVSTVTINAWKNNHPEFLNALREGKDIADANVSKSLYHRALGYSCPETDIRVIDGRIVLTEITKHYPPDTGAAMAWLKNRQPRQWRDRQEVDHQSSDGTMTPKAAVTIDKSVIKEIAKQLNEDC